MADGGPVKHRHELRGGRAVLDRRAQLAEAVSGWLQLLLSPRAGPAQPTRRRRGTTCDISPRQGRNHVRNYIGDDHARRLRGHHLGQVYFRFLRRLRNILQRPAYSRLKEKLSLDWSTQSAAPSRRLDYLVVGKGDCSKIPGAIMTTRGLQ